MRRFRTEWIMVVCMFFMQNQVKSQFIGSEIDSSLSVMEVRKGSVSEFSLASDADKDDEFRWEVMGGNIVAPGAVGSGTPASPSILEFTKDMHTISVLWQTDDSTSMSFKGTVMVQKKPKNTCVSLITKQTVKLWSMPTASIYKDNYDYTICSGDMVGGYVVVNLTGAPGYSFSYSIKSNGLKDETGKAINTEHHIISTSNDTAHIALPALLINPSEAADKYFTIELAAMNDDFLGDGEVISERENFTITVNPSVEIGTISTTKLNRR